MLLITGLGNPEKDYRNTRHNIGFEVLNKFVYDHNLAFTKAKFRSHLAEGTVYGQKVLLIKPQTYMNLSGQAVREALLFYKLGPENLIVVYDDIAVDVGDIRIRKQGSAGSHNGMKNIIYLLESDEFTRIRVGIGAKPPGYTLSDYVLSRFAKNEVESVIDGITKATDALEIILKDSTDAAMNKFNKRKPQPEPDESVDTLNACENGGNE